VNGKVLQATPYFLINVTGEGEGFSMWAPTPCDVLAEDWIEVND
ncbi:TPA: Thoeris anti-defense Tad2 family protein, partial [Streptococcus agalactiae]